MNNHKLMENWKIEAVDYVVENFDFQEDFEKWKEGKKELKKQRLIKRIEESDLDEFDEIVLGEIDKLHEKIDDLRSEIFEEIESQFSYLQYLLFPDDSVDPE